MRRIAVRSHWTRAAVTGLVVMRRASKRLTTMAASLEALPNLVGEDDLVSLADLICVHAKQLLNCA